MLKSISRMNASRKRSVECALPATKAYFPGRADSVYSESPPHGDQEARSGKSQRSGSSPIVSSTTVSGVSGVATRGVKRAFNFNAGPGALPLPVLERMREELLDYRGTGMSVMEMSHRSPEFEAISDKAERALREAAAIPEEYAVLFLQGGGSLQFAMVPMNCIMPGKPVDVLHTGAWTARRSRN